MRLSSSATSLFILVRVVEMKEDKGTKCHFSLVFVFVCVCVSLLLSLYLSSRLLACFVCSLARSRSLSLSVSLERSLTPHHLLFLPSILPSSSFTAPQISPHTPSHPLLYTHVPSLFFNPNSSRDFFFRSPSSSFFFSSRPPPLFLLTPSNYPKNIFRLFPRLVRVFPSSFTVLYSQPLFPNRPPLFFVPFKTKRKKEHLKPKTKTSQSMPHTNDKDTHTHKKQTKIWSSLLDFSLSTS